MASCETLRAEPAIVTVFAAEGRRRFCSSVWSSRVPLWRLRGRRLGGHRQNPVCTRTCGKGAVTRKRLRQTCPRVFGSLLGRRGSPVAGVLAAAGLGGTVCWSKSCLRRLRIALPQSLACYHRDCRLQDRAALGQTTGRGHSPHLSAENWIKDVLSPLVVKNPPAHAETQCRSPRRKWHPTPVFLSGESHGQKSLVLQGRKESDRTKAV